MMTSRQPVHTKIALLCLTFAALASTGCGINVKAHEWVNERVQDNVASVVTQLEQVPESSIESKAKAESLIEQLQAQAAVIDNLTVHIRVLDKNDAPGFRKPKWLYYEELLAAMDIAFEGRQTDPVMAEKLENKSTAFCASSHMSDYYGSGAINKDELIVKPTTDAQASDPNYPPGLEALLAQAYNLLKEEGLIEVVPEGGTDDASIPNVPDAVPTWDSTFWDFSS